ncbi:Growth_factor receptor cysteine-rich domain superfamily [Hexamita inflata]|uniref:Growth factor receptor cysteine-rich domain superfamily n=1 Tax=Hexamita inflata TaxID=28002 RepID=A0AA86PBN1_9EUKA|nr:Growth factor receptor cysteine-rich domain superfamily [Hexamita inflata]
MQILFQIVTAQTGAQSCQLGFIKEGELCVCKMKLSADSSKCVSLCSEINETEVNGKCTNIKVKSNIILGSYCTNNQDCYDTGIYCDNSKCTCDYSAGWLTELLLDRCVTCQEKYCSPNVKFDFISQCICDESKGFAGSDPSDCTNCWGQNMIIVNGICTPCSTGAKFQVNKCVCDESTGYVGTNPIQCMNCWDNFGIVISADSCYKCKWGNKVVNNQCACDESKGYIGIDPQSCTNCWDMDQIVNLQLQQCEQCPAGTVFELNECVCDEKNGFVGNNAQSCTDCWSDSKVVLDSQCALCSDIDLNSVYDTENACACKPHFTKKNGICQKDSVNQTIAIAVAVPVVVIILGIIITIMIVKKKKNSMNQAETPQQAQRVQ